MVKFLRVIWNLICGWRPVDSIWGPIWIKRCRDKKCDVARSLYSGTIVWGRAIKSGEIARLCASCHDAIDSGAAPPQAVLK
jgi:hypothetical protein